MPNSVNRTTLVLGGIAAVLLGYIVLVDEGSLTSGELEGRGTHVVERFVRARVTGLDLTHGDVHIVLARDQSREENMDTFDVGTWELREPVEGAADVDAVDGLLSAVEWLDAQRELEGIDAEDRTRFGFDEPRAILTFTVANESHTIRVGGDDPVGEGVYLQVDDPNHAYIVGEDFLEALTHGVEHFRSKELFPDFRTADVRHVELSLAETSASAELERVESRWWLRAPTEMMARGGTVDEMLRSVGDLRAERFLGETPADVDGELGLESPTRSITLTFAPWPEASSHSGEARPDLTLNVGAVCPGHPSELVARVGEGPVVCIAQAALERLDQPTERYQERRLFTTSDDDVERLEVVASGERFEVRRDGGGWTLARGSEDDERTSAADPSAIEEWLGELRRLEATSFEPATETVLSAHHLGDGAALVLTIHRTDDGGTEVVQVGDSGPDGVWIHRGEEPQVALFPLSATDLLQAPAIRFRGRVLADRSREDLASFTVTRADDPGHEESLHKEGSTWMLASPFEARADGAAVGDVVDALAPLSALRYVADTASREHALDRPRLVVHASFDASSEPEEDEEEDDHGHGHSHDEEDEEDSAEALAPLDIALSIGADTEGGAFARLNDDPAVFVLPSALVNALLQPLASRDALSVGASEIQSITFRRGAVEHVLARAEAGWLLDGATAPDQATVAMLDRLAELRAVGAERYDEAPLRAPVLVLSIVRRGDATPVTITIGAPEGGEDPWMPVQRDQVPVIYRCSVASLAAILEYAL